MVVATVAPAVAGAMMAAAKAAARRMTAVRAAAARAVVAMAQAVTVVADWLATRKVAVAIRVEARAVETTKTTEMTDRVRERGAGMRGGEGGVCDGRRGTVGWAGARTRKSWWQQVPAGGVPPIANRCVVAVGPEGHIEPRHGCWTRSSGASGGSRLLMTGGC